MYTYRGHSVSSRRRGATLVMAVMCMFVLLGMASLTIDVGMMYRGRAEAQASADAAALAGAMRLLDEDKLTGTPEMSEEIALARQTAVEYAALNAVVNLSPALNINGGNQSDGDIVIGFLSDPHDPNEVLSFANPDSFNTVQVRVHRDSTRNGPIDLFFAGIFGLPTAGVSAEAYASFSSGASGYRVTDNTGPAELLPFTIQENFWSQLLDGTFTTGDNYSYDADTGEVCSGSDGILEINMYPGGGGGAGQLAPGNFGTVDIGDPNNSTADLSRQIVEGVNEHDLSFFGGELALGPDGTLELNGDTGLSSGIKDELASVIGLPRAIPLFSTVSGNGNNTMYTITGFTGMRIMHVKFQGSKKTEVIVQPAFVIDDAVVGGVAGVGGTSFVYRPVELVR